MHVNPLWWVHLRMGGDARQPLWLAGGYIAILLVFTSISFRMAEVSAAQIATVWLGILSGVQALLALIAAPNTIHKAVQRDFQSGMVESLRLTPLSGLTLATGYLVGPALTLFILFAIGAVAGLLFGSVAMSGTAGLATTLPPGTAFSLVAGGWFALQVVLLMLGAFISGLMLLSAVGAAGGKFNLFGFLIAGTVFGGWVLIAFLPGMALLVGLLDVENVFNSIRAGAVAVRGEIWKAMLAGIFQVAFAVVFVLAAARKLRRPEGPLFSLPTGVALLVLWVAASAVGQALDAPPTWAVDEFGGIRAAQMAMSGGATMLLSLFLLNAAAVKQLWADRAAVFSTGRRERGLGFMSLLVATGCTFTTMIAVSGWPDYTYLLAPHGLPGLVACVVAIVLGAWMDMNALYLAQARRWRVWLVLLVLWGVYKVGFLMSDGLSVAIMEEAANSTPFWRGWLTAASPVGTLAMLAIDFPQAHGEQLMLLGLIPQALIALALRGMALRARATATSVRPSGSTGANGSGGAPAAVPALG